MRLLETNTLVKAGLDQVYEYISDLNNLYSDIEYLKESNDVKVVRSESGIEFEGKNNELLFRIIKLNAKESNRVVLKIITEGKHIKRFGNADMLIHVSCTDSCTNIETIIETEKTPGFIWRIVIKLAVLVFMFQSRNTEKAYIKRVESILNK